MAARTLAQLLTAVQDHGYGNDLTTEQTTWLNEEYRNVSGMRRWKWLEATTTGVTAVGVSAVTPAAADIRNYDAVRASDSLGNEQYLEPRPTQWVREQLHQYSQVADQAPPRYWARWAGQIILYPVPDAVYNLTIDYVRNVVAIVNPGDVPSIPEAYDDILVWGAVARSAVRQNNWLTRDFAVQQKESLLNRMEAEEGIEQRQGPIEVTWTGFWDSNVRDPRWR